MIRAAVCGFGAGLFLAGLIVFGISRGRRATWLVTRLFWASIWAFAVIGLLVVGTTVCSVDARGGISRAGLVAYLAAMFLPVIPAISKVTRQRIERKPSVIVVPLTAQCCEVLISATVGLGVPLLVARSLPSDWIVQAGFAVLLTFGFLALLVLSFAVGRLLWLIVGIQLFEPSLIRSMIERERQSDPLVPLYLRFLAVINRENRSH